jgi:signal transduction histidine kinase
MFQDWAASVLLGLSAVLGVPNTPEEPLHWSKADWYTEPSTRFLVYESQSHKMAELCKQDSASFIHFPRVIHGAHELWAISKNGTRTKILQQGDPSFKQASSFYAAPSLSCSSVPSDTKSLAWRVTSYSKYFARVEREPSHSKKTNFHNFFAVTLHILGVGNALTLGLFALTLFAGRVPARHNAAVTLSTFFASIYFVLTVADHYGMNLTMLTAHRIADIGLWISILLVAYSLRLENLIGSSFFKIYCVHVAIAIAIIAWADSGDSIQFGTSIPFGISLALTILPLRKTLADACKAESRRRGIMQTGTLLLFAMGSFNEIFSITGLLNTPPLFPLAYSGSMLFLALSVNEQINDTYRERDYLRENLEHEVERKTLALKEAQAELLQSAKLASLGTLSAGIAHEINNSLNYMNGALQPLERLIMNKVPESERGKIQTLLSVIKDGLHLTVEIVRSLRSYTGLNQAKFNDVSIRQIAETTLTILRNKLRDRIETELSIDPEIKVYGSVVGLNQVLMNLVTNAIDAMPEGGRLVIKAEMTGENVELVVQDSGSGIDKATQARIFEPFFTTKSIGSGTGLGLHIVLNEIRRHNGQIRLDSNPGEGTSFIITLPCQTAEAPSAEQMKSDTAEAA